MTALVFAWHWREAVKGWKMGRLRKMVIEYRCLRYLYRDKTGYWHYSFLPATQRGEGE